MNTLLACGDGPVIDKRDYAAFRESLRAALAAPTAGDAVADVSVFFRDLANGPTFGIDEFAPFVPASLLKLPLVLSYLAAEEAAPGLLKRTLVYDEKGAVPHQSIAPSVTIRPGQTYEIETLLANTLRFSDNASYLLLRGYLRSLEGGDAFLLHTYRELGVIDPHDVLDETVTVRGYASLFRMLYHASYLSPERSEQALAWLAQSDFAGGLVAGVPKGTTVAHKFGERELSGDDDARRWQFHDCGIVYYPRNPYLLCVMTRGRELPQLTATVQLVSKVVYDEVASREPASRASQVPWGN